LGWFQIFAKIPMPHEDKTEGKTVTISSVYEEMKEQQQ
jgi:hypothetical protein